MRRPFLCLALVVLTTLAWRPTDAVGRTDLSPEQWQRDLDFVVEQIETRHPDPFFRVDEGTFRAAAQRLREEMPSLDDVAATVRLAELVAMVEDGHTRLDPYEGGRFATWFPVRFRLFTDGLFVTMAPPEQRDLIGGRVLRIGRFSAEEAFAAAARMVPAENEERSTARTPLHLSSGEALTGLGAIDSPRTLPLRVRTVTGEVKTVELDGVSQPQEQGWFWRWLRAPAGTNAVHGFEELPVHLGLQVRGAPTYHFDYLPDSKTLYFQLVGFWDAGSEPFFDFWDRMWAFYDSHEVERFVFDLRTNGGGDGSRVTRMVHAFIRRPELEEPGRLFVLVGGKTFSASVMMAEAMERHTRATFVGEPMGAGYNHYGDAASLTLPESGMQLHVSLLYWQLSRSDDGRRVISPHVPAPFTSEDYFSGRDPALSLILEGKALGIPDLFRVHGAETALASFGKWKESYADLGWWEPFGERELNSLGYELLGAGKTADARAAFQLNADTFPDSFNVWDSLAESCMKAGDHDAARKHYRRSLHLNPGNGNARAMLVRLGAPPD